MYGCTIFLNGHFRFPSSCSQIAFFPHPQKGGKKEGKNIFVHFANMAVVSGRSQRFFATAENKLKAAENARFYFFSLACVEKGEFSSRLRLEKHIGRVLVQRSSRHLLRRVRRFHDTEGRGEREREPLLLSPFPLQQNRNSASPSPPFFFPPPFSPLLKTCFSPFSSPSDPPLLYGFTYRMMRKMNYKKSPIIFNFF